VLCLELEVAESELTISEARGQARSIRWRCYARFRQAHKPGISRHSPSLPPSKSHVCRHCDSDRNHLPRLVRRGLTLLSIANINQHIA
jgi:hypothetical protein